PGRAAPPRGAVAATPRSSPAPPWSGPSACSSTPPTRTERAGTGAGNGDPGASNGDPGTGNGGRPRPGTGEPYAPARCRAGGVGRCPGECGTRTAVRVDPTLPVELLGPLGCGFLTGAGAVLNSFA